MSEEKVPLGAIIGSGASMLYAFPQRNMAQPVSLGAEFMAVFRGGKEDLWNAAIPAFPDSLHAVREQGSPGSPTASLTTDALTGRQGGIHSATTVMSAPRQSALGFDIQPEQQIDNQQQQERGLGR
ncbi:hypothetical protein [Zavarzinella formosa]|uniref:hypothetical protein n=1 Tax=Zavarzinella formosa TaxID=360055 RepID=UPI0002F0230E|nr:hypothetical protein [Zavarzinella formosa]